MKIGIKYIDGVYWLYGSKFAIWLHRKLFKIDHIVYDEELDEAMAVWESFCE